MILLKEYENKIIELQKNREFSKAYDLLKEALSIYPTNIFLQRTEIFILLKLNKISEARAIADAKFDFLKNDIFFIKSYISILEKQKNKQELLNFIDSYIFNKKINDIDLYINTLRILKKILTSDQINKYLNIVKIFFPTNNLLENFENELKKENNIYIDYKIKFKDYSKLDAIREIENLQILPKYKDDYELNLYLASLYKDINELDKAIEIYQKLLLIKDNEFCRKMLGFVYYKKEDYENSYKYLIDIFIKNPKDHYVQTVIMKIFEKHFGKNKFQNLIKDIINSNPSTNYLYGLIKKSNKWNKE